MPETSMNDKLDPVIHDAVESAFVHSARVMDWQKQPGYSFEF